MKTYIFTTEKGSEVIIETEHSDVYYFGMYITCEAIGVSHKWHSPSVLQVYQSRFFVFSDKLQKVVAIQIPQGIFTDIQSDYKEVCSHTGKIVVATVMNRNNIIRQKFGFANADVQFQDMVNYLAPKSLENYIRSLSCDGKICLYASDPDSTVDYLFASDGHKGRFYISHFSPNDPFFPEKTGTKEEGTFEVYEITLEVVTPYKD